MTEKSRCVTVMEVHVKLQKWMKYIKLTFVSLTEYGFMPFWQYFSHHVAIIVKSKNISFDIWFMLTNTPFNLQCASYVFKYNSRTIEYESGRLVVLWLVLGTETWYRVWGVAPDDDLKILDFGNIKYVVICSTY